jgi:hypothetical protein
MMAHARAEQQRRSAERAAADPRQLARATRIVRSALRRGLLDPDELTIDSAAS